MLIRNYQDLFSFFRHTAGCRYDSPYLTDSTYSPYLTYSPSHPTSYHTREKKERGKMNGNSQFENWQVKVEVKEYHSCLSGQSKKMPPVSYNIAHSYLPSPFFATRFFKLFPKGFYNIQFFLKGIRLSH